jgi:hypothetical protein
MVDNSILSPNLLTIPAVPVYPSLIINNLLILSISSDEDPYDAVCVLAPAFVLPHSHFSAALFPLLVPSWSCPVGSSNQAYPAPTPSQATLPTRLPRLSSLLRPLSVVGPVPPPVRPWREVKSMDALRNRAFYPGTSGVFLFEGRGGLSLPCLL